MFLNFFLVVLLVNNISGRSNDAFDLDLYENVLDPDQCDIQLRYIRNNASMLRTQFLDASWRVPRNILQGNTRDLGGYFECLAINEKVLDMAIDGKYCAVRFPVEQEDFELPTLPPFPEITWPEDWNITWPEIPWPESESRLEFPWEVVDLKDLYTEEMKAKWKNFEKAKRLSRFIVGDDSENLSRTGDIAWLSTMTFELAVCVPKVCTTRQALDFFTNNLTSTMTFTDLFCRLPNDKTWVPADTIATVLLSIIGLITILSTAYDIRHSILLDRDPKQANELFLTFSVFTNTRKFFIFPSGPNVVTCLDGIRSFAMMWVIVGHTFVVQLAFIPENLVNIFEYILSFSSVWITSSPITVDTFFLLSGLLVVYTTAAKVTRSALLKNLHLFYLNRLLRMFPVLAFTILITASILHRMADGPYFTEMANWVNNCRDYWWTTLLYVQNFVNPGKICQPHTWYLAIDMQLYIISPLVLFWLLGERKKSSIFIVVGSLIAVLIAATVYNFIHNFQSNVMAFGPRPADSPNYHEGYYVHTLPRAAPFFVGMVVGYLLHIYREKRVKIPMVLVLSLWVLAISCTSFVVALYYWTSQLDWENQTLDNVINSYHRAAWAAAIGWMIFACHKGYGGPVNWLLSLTIFKILGRLSYAMYLLHFPLMYLIDGTTLTPVYFTVPLSIHRFLFDFTLAVVAAFLVTIIIDMPFSNLIKMALEGKRKRPPPNEKTLENINSKTN